MPPARAPQRRRLEVLERGQVVLRRLRGDRVLVSGLRLDPERRCRLEAPRQRDEQVRGHVALGQAEERRLDAVDVDMELGVIEDLMDAQVDGARHAAIRSSSRLAYADWPRG